MLHALPYSPAITRTLDQAATELDGLDGLDAAEALRSTTNTQLEG